MVINMKKGLGRGLNALLPENTSEDNNETTTLRLSQIEPNKNQPRKDFDLEKLESLANSIKEHGLIQPIIVCKNKSGMYTIVAGERRWRASKIAEIDEVPVVIKEYSDEQIAQIALIENLQREDLNPIEEALGYYSLINEHEMTQENVSEKIGKSRSAIANSLRLLTLSDDIKNLLVNGEITGGHARAILSLDDDEKRMALAQMIINENLNVRQAEKLAKELQKEKIVKKDGEKVKTAYDIELKALGDQLSTALGTKVTLLKGKKKNKIEIEYYDDNDLERIIDMIGVN